MFNVAILFVAFILRRLRANMYILSLSYIISDMQLKLKLNLNT